MPIGGPLLLHKSQRGLERLVQCQQRRIVPRARILQERELPVRRVIEPGFVQHEQRGVGIQFERHARLNRIGPIQREAPRLALRPIARALDQHQTPDAGDPDERQVVFFVVHDHHGVAAELLRRCHDSDLQLAAARGRQVWRLSHRSQEPVVAQSERR